MSNDNKKRASCDNTQHFTIFIHVPGNTAFVLCILSLRDMKARLMMYLTLIQLFQHIQCFNYQFILRIVHYIVRLHDSQNDDVFEVKIPKRSIYVCHVIIQNLPLISKMGFAAL